MPAPSKIRIGFLCLFLALLAVHPAWAHSLEELESLAASDFIPEVRAAASEALTKKYVQGDLELDRLRAVAASARTDQPKTAAVRALAKEFEDVKKVGSLQEALTKAKELEEKVVKGDSAEVKEAASMALGLYYLAFNLNKVEGYSMEELEEVAIGGNPVGLREAASTALKSIYPNHYSGSELEELIRNSSHKTIQRGAAGALAIRYTSQMPPNPSLEELRKTASDEKNNRWLRKAAGQAFGELAREVTDPEVLKKIASSGDTEEIRQGAASAWANYLIGSEKSGHELLQMACATTGSAPPAYQQALVTALADRMLKSNSTT